VVGAAKIFGHPEGVLTKKSFGGAEMRALKRPAPTQPVLGRLCFHHRTRLFDSISTFNVGDAI